MLAARMYGKEDIRLEEIAKPVLRTGEILIKVKAAAICGTDIRMYRNGYKGITKDAPRILGHEFSGIIEEIADGVKGYQAGQRVAVAPNMGCGICSYCVAGSGHLCHDYRALGINLDGAFAEYVAIPSAAVSGGNVCVLDDGVSFEEAAVNEALSCVCNGFERCAIRPGDSVLVIGAGPIGIMHAMLAKMAGAAPIFIHDLSQERLAICRTIDPDFRTIEDNLKESVLEATAGEGVNVCITACPSPAAQQTALEVTGVNGRVNFFGGIPADKQKVSVDTNLIHYKQLIVTGTTRASLTQYRNTLRFIATGILDVKKLISRKIPLRDIMTGFELAQKADGLKNVICM